MLNSVFPVIVKESRVSGRNIVQVYFLPSDHTRFDVISFPGNFPSDTETRIAYEENMR